MFSRIHEWRIVNLYLNGIHLAYFNVNLWTFATVQIIIWYVLHCELWYPDSGACGVLRMWTRYRSPPRIIYKGLPYLTIPLSCIAIPHVTAHILKPWRCSEHNTTLHSKHTYAPYSFTIVDNGGTFLERYCRTWSVQTSTIIQGTLSQSTYFKVNRDGHQGT